MMVTAGTPRSAPGRAVIRRAPPGPGALVGRLTEASAPDIIDTLMPPQVHHNLTTQHHWDADQYEYWLGREQVTLPR